MKEKLRIGILLNNYSIPSWEYQIVNQIRNSEFSEIVVVIRYNSVCSSLSGKKSTISAGIIALIEKVDRLVFKTNKDFKRRVDLSDALRSIRLMEINPEQAAFDTSGHGALISELSDLNLDIIIKFGCQKLTEDILKIPKFGIWTFSVDSASEFNSPDPGFWEVISRIPVTNSMLGILRPDNGRTEVLFNSWESTCPYSININRDCISWRSALFAPRIIYGIYRYGEHYLDSLKNRFSAVSSVSDRSLSPVSPAYAAGSMFRYMHVVAKSIIKKLLFTDAFRWQLLFDINGGSKISSTEYGSFRKLSSPAGIFWADPFVIAGDDRYFIFVEEFIYRKDRAHISVLELDKNGDFISSRKIIERPYHMSYPFIFKMYDTYYMIPETCRNKTIEIYKCIEFPYKWEFERNIMENISAVDTTLFQFNNKWWLFTAVDQTANISGCSTELFLFFTDDVMSGKWESHPLNPVVSDIRTARPAGNIFIQNGKICRPSQNCSGRYGIGFNINHITKLTEFEYEETMLSEIKPEWDKKLRGTHTLNFDRDFTVIDVYSFRSRFLFF